MNHYQENVIAALEQRGLIRPGENWHENLFAGAPGNFTANDARELANWIESDAAIAWGADNRYTEIANVLRDCLLYTADW